MTTKKSAPRKLLITLSLPTKVGNRIIARPNVNNVLEVPLYKVFKPTLHHLSPPGLGPLRGQLL